MVPGGEEADIGMDGFRSGSTEDENVHDKEEYRTFGYCSLPFVSLLSLFTTTGGFVFGYDIGVINGVKDMEEFKRFFGYEVPAYNFANATKPNLTTNAMATHNLTNGTWVNTTTYEISVDDQGWIVSAFSLGCLFMALASSPIMERAGRKVTILVGAAVFTVGGLLQSGAYYLWMVYTGRIVAGFGVGILSTSVPVYIAEIAPAEKRGRLVSLNQLSITAGIMVSFIVNLACRTYVHGWRISLALQSVFSLIFFVGMLFAPETPRYLMMKKQRAKAMESLNWIRTGRKRCVVSDSSVGKDILWEVNSIATEIEEGSVRGGSTWRDVFEWKIFRRLLVGMWIQLFQQFTGMNVIMYYSTQIFGKINVAEFVSTAVVGIINFLTTFGTLALVDKAGRKPLLLLGSLSMVVTCALGGTVIVASGGNDNLSEAQGYLVVLSVCAFVFSFALTWGPVAWVVTSEIFPLRVRGKLVSITTASNWAANFAIGKWTPLLLLPSVLDVQGILFLMAVLNTAALIFVLLAVPETKGRSLESMDQLFERDNLLDSSDYTFYLRCIQSYFMNDRASAGAQYCSPCCCSGPGAGAAVRASANLRRAGFFVVFLALGMLVLYPALWDQLGYNTR